MRLLKPILVLSLILIGGCATIRSRTVPMALNPISAPSRNAGQLHVRETTNTGVAATDELGTALFLPRVQIEGGLALRLSQYFTLRLRAGVYLDIDAQPANSGSRRAPGQAGYTYGVAPTLTVPLDHGRTLLTVAPDLNIALMPSVWRTDETCEGADGITFACGSSSDQLDFGFVLGGAVGAFRWVDDRVRLGGTVGVRGQPSVDGGFGQAPPTSLGHVAVVLGAEVLVQVTEGLFFSVESQWLGVVGPYTVFPTVGITLGGSFGNGRGEDPLDISTWLEGEG